HPAPLHAALPAEPNSLHGERPLETTNKPIPLGSEVLFEGIGHSPKAPRERSAHSAADERQPRQKRRTDQSRGPSHSEQDADAPAQAVLPAQSSERVKLGGGLIARRHPRPRTLRGPSPPLRKLVEQRL